MTGADPAGPPVVELAELGFDRGAHVLVALALEGRAAGAHIEVTSSHPQFLAELTTWCRQQGHTVLPFEARPGHEGESTSIRRARVVRGRAATARWIGAEPAGGFDPALDGAVVAHPAAHWGLAARGAWVEAGGPQPAFALDRRDEVWTPRAAALYAQAAAGQWDPDTAVDWAAADAEAPLAAPLEVAIGRLMLYLIENEEAALVVPARFLGQIHPHFREVQQVLAVTVADEARHIEVFSRRARRAGVVRGLSSVGGRLSLQTLIDEPDFAVASFLLSAMGEGTFVSLLGFVERHAPDALTRRIAGLTRADEARHVAFALSHLERHAQLEVGLRARLARAAERRHDALRSTAGLNEEVFDALVLLAAGDATPDAIAAGWVAVQQLQHDMEDGRRARLARLGYTPTEAEAIAALHTRNFM